MPKHTKSSLDNILDSLYLENTIFGIVVLAIVVFFARIVFPEQADKLSNILIPSFIIVVCIEIYLIRKQVKHISQQASDDFSFQAFNSGDDFDNYLANRLKSAKEVKVISLSSSTLSKRAGRRYYEIVQAFVQKGGKFTRIMSDTNNRDIFTWIKEDLKEFEKHKYFVHFVSNIKVDSIKQIGVMIIDNEEICLGGGYDASFDYPTISIRQENIVNFFSDHFQYLLIHDKTEHVRSSMTNIKLDFIEKRIAELEK